MGATSTNTGPMGQESRCPMLPLCVYKYEEEELWTGQFLNSVRLWDFIEEREHRAVPQYEDDVSDLGELFMQLSGAGEESGTSATH